MERKYWTETRHMTVVMHGAISEYVLGPPMQDDIIFGRVLYVTDRLASTSGETTENLHGVKVFDMCTCMAASNIKHWISCQLC